jgi:hypothetical protein
MAIAADMGASLLVIFNGLRMLRKRETDKQRHDDGKTGKSIR